MRVLLPGSGVAICCRSLALVRILGTEARIALVDPKASHLGQPSICHGVRVLFTPLQAVGRQRFTTCSWGDGAGTDCDCIKGWQLLHERRKEVRE